MRFSNALPVMSLAAVLLSGASALAADPVGGQPIKDPAAGITRSDEPIHITSNTLDVSQNDNIATFVGNVVVVQGDMRMTSDRLKITMVKNNDTAKPARDDKSSPVNGGGQISTIDATGNVHVVTANDQSADGQWAHYDAPTKIITMGDNVVLRQGQNVIKGAKLVVNLDTNKSMIYGAGGDATKPGRVEGLFLPPPKK
ncbi:MAG: LptA/OstA family protein [Parvibaculaceae bacterium]|nr:LptA/OstA family protein [Parvibaculaceae bacterium]